MALSLPNRWFLLAALFLTVLTLAIWLLPLEVTLVLDGEEGVIERGTAILFVVAALGFGWTALRTRRWLRAQAVFWALLAIVAAGEETSWLQHELGYETPAAIADANVQGEFNLHNLRGLHGGKLLEADDSETFLGVLSAQNLFQLGFAGYFLALPLLALLPAVRSVAARFQLPYLAPDAVLAVWLPIGTAIALAFVTEGALKSLLAETRELHYAAAFVLLSVALLLHVRAEAEGEPALAAP